MDIGEALRALALVTMAAPMLARHVPALRPYQRLLWRITAAVYLAGGGALVLWRAIAGG